MCIMVYRLFALNLYLIIISFVEFSFMSLILGFYDPNAFQSDFHPRHNHKYETSFSD